MWKLSRKTEVVPIPLCPGGTLQNCDTMSHGLCSQMACEGVPSGKATSAEAEVELSLASVVTRLSALVGWASVGQLTDLLPELSGLQVSLFNHSLRHTAWRPGRLEECHCVMTKLPEIWLGSKKRLRPAAGPPFEDLFGFREGTWNMLSQGCGRIVQEKEPVPCWAAKS